MSDYDSYDDSSDATWAPALMYALGSCTFWLLAGWRLCQVLLPTSRPICEVMQR